VLLVQVEHPLGLELVHVDMDDLPEYEVVHRGRMRYVLHLVQEDEERVGRQLVVRVVQDLHAQLVQVLDQQRERTPVQGLRNVHYEILCRL